MKGVEIGSEFLASRDGSLLVVPLKAILGQIANWAIRQSPYTVPDELRECIEVLNSRMEPEAMVLGEMLYFEFQDMISMMQFLEGKFKGVEQIERWNTPRNGKSSSSGFVFVSTNHSLHPDDDFIDIHALIRNVANDCIRESIRVQES